VILLWKYSGRRGNFMTYDVAPASNPKMADSQIPMILASVWLLVSIVVGLILMTGGPNKSGDVRATLPSLSSSASRSAYGGDAYTGIQNAAADTENAVIASANSLAQLELTLAQATSQSAAASGKNTQFGIGFLIIALAVGIFVLTLRRPTS